MEIIHLILGKANPNRMNGVNKVVYQLASKQAEAGKKVSVWGITADPKHNYGERCFETELFQSSTLKFLLPEKLKAAIRAKKGSAVFHLHGGWIPVYYSAALFLSKEDIPFVITPHGAYNTIARKRSKWIKSIYFSIFERKILNRAQQIHAIGESEVEGLNEIYKNNKSFLLPYGFQAADSKSAVYKDNQQFIIGFVGRLDIYTKGIDLLIDAFNRFQKKYANSHLWIIGDSKERADLVQMIQYKNCKNVKLWGSKYGSDKDELIQKMHVFAHPSRNEGLPSAILEAAALGVPAVASKATNISSIIQNFSAGIGVPNNDVNALFEAFEKFYSLYGTKEYTEMSNNAAVMVQQVFDWNKLVHKFDELYQISNHG